MVIELYFNHLGNASCKTPFYQSISSFISCLLHLPVSKYWEMYSYHEEEKSFF